MPSHDSLNFFDPNKDIAAHHENQLTRAFLVVLRISPAAHQVWLSFAAPHHKLYELPRPWSFDTQRWKMIEKASEVSEPIAGISILLAADADVIDKPVQITDRSQVLDGIVRYGDELLIVIETKLDGPVSSRQAEYLNIHEASVQFDSGVQRVSWRYLLAAWSGLVESGVVSGAERTVIVDFLDFVERYFPKLGPYTTLSKCKNHKFRVDRRLNSLVEEIAGGPTMGWLGLPGRSTLNRAYLEFDEHSKTIQLIVYPADTLTQAKAFYTRSGAISSTLSLRAKGWRVKPNFHFGHVAAGRVWTTIDASLEQYVVYWQEKIADTWRNTREDWEGFWSELVQQRFAETSDKAEFDRWFTNSKRNSATPRPGLGCFYSWNLPDAAILDDKNQFAAAVAHQLNIVLRALDEKPLESQKSSKLSK